MKRYISPTYEVVSINCNDILTISGVQGNVFNGGITGSTEAGRAPDRRNGNSIWD